MPDGTFMNDATPWAVSGGAGILGRLMYHAKLVQQGKRKPFSVVLMVDIPIALGMAWISLGLSKWMNVIDREPQVALAIVAAYIGTYGLDILFARWAEWKFGRKSDG